MTVKLSTRQELLWAIEREPFSDERRLEYAKWLMGHGNIFNPRAELIFEQLKPEPDPERVKGLLDENGRRWMAEDLGISDDRIPPGASVEFYKGFGWWPVQATYPNFQAAVDAGKYERANSIVTAGGFGLRDGETIINEKMVLYVPHRNIGSEEAVHEMRRCLRLHLDSDQVWELCVFSETYPDVQRGFPIAALGSVCVRPSGGRDVACLGSWDAERELYLSCWGGRWCSVYRFLAARKESLWLLGS